MHRWMNRPPNFLNLMGLIIKKKPQKTKIKQEMSIFHDLFFLEKNKRYEQQSLIISRVVS